jgi:hypothetical protein
MATRILKVLPTVEKIRAAVSYNHETGVITRKSTGKPISDKHNGDGYLQLSIARCRCYAHRIAWILMTGSWPSGQIDHINGDRADNRFANLRDVDQHTNMQNIRNAPISATSGVLGASPSYGRFRACIRVDGRFKHLGRFDTAEEAHHAYVSAKRKYHAGCTL